ncbi:MAG: ABC transporter permease [Clostridiales bacterium]|nr:ABC transporter permease [Clostridiales bacterium]
MVRYVIRRLLITIPIIVAVAIIVFTLMYFVPGDPAVLILGEAASEEELAAMREYLGVNRPYIVQLLDYLKQLFIDFDLGTSWIYKTNITTELYNRMPTTFAICVYSILVSACLGIPLGVMAAVNQDRWPDKLVLWMSSIFTCIPNYCWALLFIVVFALNLGWFPIYGVSQGWKSYVLPCLSILMGSFTGLARQTRSSMLEVIRSDYVVSARAQGYSRNTVYYLHALPNALIPIITILGTQFAAGLGGTLILETIFSIPGVGLYVTGAITKRDYPAVMGCVVFLAILFCLIMLGVDVLYAIVDPRVRAQYEARGAKRRHKA